MAEKEQADEVKVTKKKTDIFQKVYDTATGLLQNSVDMLQKKFDSIVRDVQKKAFFFAMMFLAGLFFLYAVSEFIGVIFPWYGKTAGYLSVAAVLALIALVFKKGMN